MSIESLFVVLTTLLGGLSTFMLQSKSMVSKVQASAITTLIFSTALYWVVSAFDLMIDSTLFMAIFWGASFIGMSSSKIIDWKSILIASAIFALLFELSESVEKSHGGKLGLLAAIASIAALAIVSILAYAHKRLK